MYKQIIMTMIPEILLATMICIILLLDVLGKQKCIWINYTITVVTMLIASYCAVKFYDGNDFADLGFVFNKTTMALKVVLCVVASMAFLYSRQYMQLRGLVKGEYFILYLLTVLGMLLLISSNNFLTMYLAIELFSLPMYALVALYHKSHASLEAAVKYFLMGALASGILLYGISLLYGASSDITFVTMPIAIERLMVFKFSMVFILAGLFFKLGLMPFHMWLPDVYEGAPTSVTALLATAPKIAVAVVVGRFLFSTYALIITDWQHIIIVLAVLSIGFGNLVAIVQNNIKRMLAYSTIANIGFAILGFMIKEPFGFAAAMFYVVSYSIMYLGIFGVLLLLSKDDITFIELEDFNGLWIRYPWLAVALLLLLFALVGIPPFAGFYAKFLVLKMLMEHGFVDLAILAVVFSVIGVFYCLKIVKAIFFECAVTYPLKQSISPFEGIVLACNCLVVVFLGIFVAI